MGFGGESVGLDVLAIRYEAVWTNIVGATGAKPKWVPMSNLTMATTPLQTQRDGALRSLLATPPFRRFKPDLEFICTRGSLPWLFLLDAYPPARYILLTRS